MTRFAKPRIARRHPLMSPQAFAEYGCNSVGYVRQMRSEDAVALYPQAPKLVPGLTVFVLHAADGTPLCITDTFAEASRDAESSKLNPVRVH
jgi:hypothetical protein